MKEKNMNPRLIEKKQMPEDIFTNLIENTNDLIHTITPDGRFVYVNNAWLQRFGYTEDEVRNITMADIIHPDSMHHCNNIFDYLLGGQKVDKFEAELLSKHGEKIYVEVSSHCIFKNDKPVYIQCILHDITQRMQSEEALRQLKTIESTILTAIPHAVIGLKEREIIFANESVEKVFGWKSGELTGKNTRLLYRSDEEYNEIADLFYPVLMRQSKFSEEFPCRRKDGTDILCKVTASVTGPILHNKGIVVVYEDITESKRMMEALRKSEKKYLDLYRNAPDGYHSLGPDGKILEVNDTWLRLFRYEREEVTGKMNFKDMITEDNLLVFQTTFDSLKEKGSIENIEISLKKKDGSLLPVLINATVLYDDNGRFLKTRTIIRDISTRTGYKNMLEHAIEEWRITFDSMPYGVILIDTDFSIKRANKYFAELFGIPFKNILDLKCGEVIRSAKLRENLMKLSSGNNVTIEPFEYFEPVMYRYFLIYLTSVSNKHGIVESFVLAFIDITEIKDKETKLQDSRDAFFNMLKELDFSYKELKGLYDGLVHSFVNALDAKSPWTKGHSDRVMKYALSIAEGMDIDLDDRDTLRIAALLHDIGKIGTYDIILDKPDKLSPEQYHLISLHTVKGVDILKPIKQLQNILPIIRHHHERMDGRGYPDGLKGDEIPLLARILCVADAFDSMTSDRPYRVASNIDYAVSELVKCSNTQFDEQAVEAFLRAIKKGVLSPENEKALI
ncbi:MAG: PAS domain S-box protein [Thermodesulfovibrionales bacterium]|jgi:PAS domain S-box-containing protein/putative nucleotidyltransferase with HDIG domain